MFRFLLCLIHSVATLYSYKDYLEYKYQWKNLTQSNKYFKQVILNYNSTQLPHTDCGNYTCQYPIYQYNSDPKQLKPIIFFISGFHGDEPIGPHILLEFAKKIKTGHIIFFPLANPSGYVHKTRQQYPSKIDINRDFPYSNNNCMKSATTRIIDLVYRRFKIDLTVTIHQGGEELAYNWGTRLHKGETTSDEVIYKDIAEGVIRHLKTGMFGINKIETGQMNDIVYSAEGSFEDWAYAASWDKSNNAATCETYKFQKYPEDMHQGLIFLFESAPHRVQQTLLESQDQIRQKSANISLKQFDYISRGVRILQNMVDVANPRLQIKTNSKQIKFYVYGCKTGKVFLTVSDRVFKSEIKGSLNEQFGAFTIDLEELNFTNLDNISVKYQLSCDKEWRGIGRSAFSRGREYQGTKQFSLSEQSIIQIQQQSFSIFGFKFITIVIVFVIASVIFLIIFCALVRVCIRSLLKSRKLQVIKHEIIKSEQSFRSSSQVVVGEVDETL